MKNRLNHSNSGNKKTKVNIIPASGKTAGFLYGLEPLKQKLSQSKTYKDSSTGKKNDDNTEEIGLEDYSVFFADRLKILFGNLIENDHFIGQFIGKTQSYLVKKSKLKSSYFGETTVDIYNIMICFKEAVANYCLVIRLYLMKGNYNSALELFLLMIQKNKHLFEYIYKKIKEQLPKITNFNRIGKYFPSITKKYFEILSCSVKLSVKFNKPNIHFMLMNYYLKTFIIVSETVSLRFGLMVKSFNFNSDFDIRHIGKYLYANILFDIGIFYFIRYYSFSFTIKLLKHILDLYNDCILNDLLIIEKILLLRTNYNLCLFLYVDGHNKESIKHLLEAKNILREIKLLPLSKELTQKKSGILPKSDKYENKSKYSKLSNDKKNSFQDSLFQNKKHGDFQKMKEGNCKRKSNAIVFGNKTISFDNNYDNIFEKLFNEIELILAEIELSNNAHKEAFEHINKILKTNNSRKRSGYSNIISGIAKTYKTEGEKEKEDNCCNYKLLNDFDKRKIMALLSKLEDKYTHRDRSMDRIYQIKNDKFVTSGNYFGSKEMEKFFLFLCSLSQYQLKILNESQPKASILRNSLPIIISNQFKDCLTHSQRMNLIILESMSLSRYSILKNPNKDITPDNLDYLYMKYNIKERNPNQKNEIINKRDNNIKMQLYRTTRRNNKNKFFGINFSKVNNSGKINDDEEKNEFSKMLDGIINDKNKEFIVIFRESILNVLINLNDDEKQLFKSSKSFLKDLVKNMEKKMVLRKK